MIPSLNLVSKTPYFAPDVSLEIALKTLQPISILKRIFSRKSSQDSLESIFYTLLLLPFLQIKTVHSLFRQDLNHFLKGGKDVLYDFMKNQHINWELLVLRVNLLFINKVKWNREPREEDDEKSEIAFVVDDSLKERRGKKMEAASLHYDHNRGVKIFGQQVLQLGISTKDGFLPLLAHFFVGKKKRTQQSKMFSDGRRAVAKSYSNAHRFTKHDLLAQMLKKALSFGFSATYFIGDAWFGVKKNIKLALHHRLIGIFMMKRGKTKYEYKGKLYTSKELYRKLKKKMAWVNGKKEVQAFSVNVGYNLARDPKHPEWTPVKLLFCRMNSAPKSSWVVLCCTQETMEIEKILSVYSLRWNIEVYFKEVKQYFGFLKEQSFQYTVSWASLHLTMIRYILFFYLGLVHSSWGFSELRNRMSQNMKIFSYGIIMLNDISEIISQTMDDYSEKLGKDVTDEMHKDINKRINHYLEDLFPIALGITEEQIRKMDEAEKSGHL